ncbi:MAG TPA: sigma-54 dependent transcriptional regulator [Acidobacteriota bacterium]|nr:sigma-54 dependent transcriptional regulator [Acidobacteriota bacterium]
MSQRSRDSRKRPASGQREPAELAASDPEVRGLWETAGEAGAQPTRAVSRQRRAFVQNMIGVSPRMQRVFRLIEKVAPTDSSVLLTGESGTGKEMVATAIHLQSARAHRPFVTVNAAAIPETLFESELFGHVRGAFTGAVADRVGLLNQADGGTIFLDEAAEMPASVQVKLLRALQSGEVRRVGAPDSSHVDVRVIAATNRDVHRAMAEGALREDLYYRLSVFHIELPPLRERREDIPLLADFFRERYARRLGKRVERFGERAQYYLMRYDYPGNVRELENAVQRAVTLAEGPELSHLDLPPNFREAPVPLLRDAAPFPYSESLTLAQLEAEHIRRVLSHFANNTTKAAKSLGISRSTLWRKMKDYKI